MSLEDKKLILSYGCTDDDLKKGVDPDLTELYINGAQNITVEAIWSLAEATKLRIIHISYYRYAYSKEWFAKFPLLEELHLTHSQLDSFSIPELPLLTHINLNNCRISSQGLNTLTRLPNLLKLEICNLKVNRYDKRRGFAYHRLTAKLDKLVELHTEGDIKLYLDNYPNLTTLNLCDNSIFVDEDMKTFPVLSNLTTLSLNKCSNFSNIGIHELICLTNLRKLDATGVSDSAVSAIGNLTQLKILYLEDTGLHSINTLSRLTQLTELHLDRCDCLTDRETSGLVNFSHLTKLSISGSNLTYCVLKHISTISQLSELKISLYGKKPLFNIDYLLKLPLKKLNISLTRMDDNHMAVISRIVSLERLELHDSSFTDIGLAYLANLKHLTHLKIHFNNRITGSSLQSLLMLTELNLFACSNVNKSLFYSLNVLPELKRVVISNCTISSNEVKDYIKSRPQVEVKYQAL